MQQHIVQEHQDDVQELLRRGSERQISAQRLQLRQHRRDRRYQCVRPEPHREHGG